MATVASEPASKESPLPSPKAGREGSPVDDKTGMAAATEDSQAVPLAPPFEHHRPELLPEVILKTYPVGNPQATTRTEDQEAALQERKHELLRSMTIPEMEKRYKDVAGQITELLVERVRVDEQVKAEIEKLEQARELEIKVWKKMKEMRD